MNSKLITIILAVVIVISPATAAPKYYGYGDSITTGNYSWDGYTNDLNPNGSDMYLFQMAQEHDPGASVEHSMDGGGKTSRWGLDNIDNHYSPGTTYFIVMFGNDAYFGINGTETGQNLLEMYNYASMNGSIPIILMPTLRNPATDIDISYNISMTQDYLNENEIPFVTMYKYDGSDLFSYVGTYQPDNVHPNKTGHLFMGRHLWNNYFADDQYTFTWFGSGIGGVPVTGDWNGDGKDEIGSYNEGAWYLDVEGTGNPELATFYWFTGGSGSVPVVGDWNGDGKTEIGAYNNGAWYLDTDGTGNPANATFYYLYAGLESSPVVGDWDGNGGSDIGIYNNGAWYRECT
jgi:lysophospholipase L1-like esterase